MSETSEAGGEHQATARLLHGAPIGLPDGQVICNSCNRSLADCYDEPVTHADEVYVYVTKDPHTNQWYLRWCNCPDCGPIGSGKTTDPDELHATASLAYDGSLECFVIDEAQPLMEAES